MNREPGFCSACSSLKPRMRPEGATWLQCESYYKAHYVCSDTGGNLSKKRERDNSLTLSAPKDPFLYQTWVLKRPRRLLSPPLQPHRLKRSEVNFP